MLGLVGRGLVKSGRIVTGFLTPALEIRCFNTSRKSLDQSDEDFYSVPIEEYIKTIDTTLTTEQRQYVNTIKKKIHGANYKRSLLREVPTKAEITEEAGFLPNVLNESNKLIDFALSKTPVRAGPRRSRHKRRVALRVKTTQAKAARIKAETKAANVRKRELAIKHRKHAAMYREMIAKMSTSSIKA